jgi:hypothetical protein
VILFNWTATGWLADDEYYVLQLTWPDGSSSEYWTKGNSWRITSEDDSVAGTVDWRVGIMRQTGTATDRKPVGEFLAEGVEVRTVEWSIDN